ncbi:MAG: hypothetical protein MGG11_22085, partial [Trichodesmium sp. MAG_R03]|nr:hypothetical protein [Trichodesmium sp. MAG_R03]
TSPTFYFRDKTNYFCSGVSKFKNQCSLWLRERQRIKAIALLLSLYFILLWFIKQKYLILVRPCHQLKWLTK